jgi:NAD-dependent dihydropyrimidine dehydrogenase PreA subunit
MPHAINSEECVACGACASQCPVEAIAEGSDGKYHINPDVCTDCGSCVDICPVTAIAPK